MFRWPADGLIERVNERIKKQIEKVEEMTGDMDAKTNFSLIVIQTELERWKYLVRGYLRARIAKVCGFSATVLYRRTEIYIANLPPFRSTSTLYTTSPRRKRAPSFPPRRSPMQRATKRSYKAITTLHFYHSSRPRCEISMIRPGVLA